MTSQRVTPYPLVFALLLMALTLQSTTACATAKTTARAHAWRPGWLPGDPAPSAAATPVWMRPVTVTSPGLYIAIDPVTRRPIPPTPEQIRAWNQQHAQDALLAPGRPSQVQKLPNGGEIIHLNGAFRSYSVAKRGGNGRFTVTETTARPTAEVK